MSNQKIESITLKPNQGYYDATTGFRFHNNTDAPQRVTFSGSKIISREPLEPVPDAEMAEYEASLIQEEFRAFLENNSIESVKTSTNREIKTIKMVRADGLEVKVSL